MAFISQIIEQHPDAGYWHQQYPWFCIGQLVNTANNKDTPAFTESARRTAVFFNDIPRLHWLLYQQEAHVTALQALVNPATSLPQTGIQKIAAETVGTKGSTDQAGQIVKEEKSATPDISVIDIVAVTDTSASTNDHTVDDIKPEPGKAALSFTPGISPQETAEVVTQARVEDYHPIQTVTDPSLTHPTFGNSFFDPAIANTSDTEDPEDAEPEDSGLIPLPTSMLSASLAQAADNYRNASLHEDAIVFKTAYQHTIDYFASQGIQLDGEPAKDDQFGRQLKTFTSWLRQMKRLPDAPVQETDPLVESHAEHSLQQGEVLTESMADVLLKQGKINHALAVLEKLRLLHPQKSHYFAARIEQIKHS